MRHLRLLLLLALGLAQVAMPATTAPTVSQVTLAWTAPTLNTDGSAITAAQAISYNIYQYGNAVWAKVGNSATVTYTVVGLVPGTTYNFHVTAMSASGTESGSSNNLAITTPGGSTPPPAPPATPNPPTNLKGTASSS